MPKLQYISSRFSAYRCAFLRFDDLKSEYTYDTMEVDGGASMAISWKDVLAVYAVKTTTSTENAHAVVTIDDVNMNLLRTDLGYKQMLVSIDCGND